MSTILFPLVDQQKWSEAEEDQAKNGLRQQEGSDARCRWTRNSSFRGSITEEDMADYPLVAVGQTHEKTEQESSQLSSIHPKEGKKTGHPPVSQVNASLNNFLDMQEKESTSIYREHQKYHSRQRPGSSSDRQWSQASRKHHQNSLSSQRHSGRITGHCCIGPYALAQGKDAIYSIQKGTNFAVFALIKHARFYSMIHSYTELSIISFSLNCGILFTKY